jgi:hypothetical protein
LWHGQVQRALELINDTLEPLDAVARGASPAATPAAKLAGVLRSLETYVSGNPLVRRQRLNIKKIARDLAVSPTPVRSPGPDGGRGYRDLR